MWMNNFIISKIQKSLNYTPNIMKLNDNGYMRL